MPARIELIDCPTPTPLNELGVKGVGETGVLPMAAAIAVGDRGRAGAVRRHASTRVPLSPQDVVGHGVGDRSLHHRRPRMTTRITIRRPDDWHCHMRDNEMLRACLPYTARVFGRAILHAEPAAAGAHDRRRHRLPRADRCSDPARARSSSR